MSGSKILWVQVIAVFGIVIAAIWGATEWTAWQLAFQPELGAPWWVAAGLPMYLPPAFFWWWFAYDAYAPEVFLHGAYIVAAGRRSPSSLPSPCQSGVPVKRRM